MTHFLSVSSLHYRLFKSSVYSSRMPERGAHQLFLNHNYIFNKQLFLNKTI